MEGIWGLLIYDDLASVRVPFLARARSLDLVKFIETQSSSARREIALLERNNKLILKL